MDAREIVSTLLEADLDYVGDLMQYAYDTKEKTADWLVPKEHPWVHDLRSLGFKLKHNEYTPRTGEDKGKRIEYWSAERDTKMKSGQRLRVTISQYDQPELDGAIGVSIYVPAEGSHDEHGIWGSTPIPKGKAKRVIADIIRRLERTKVEYDWNSYTRGLQETVDKILKPYDYWENNRD